MIFEGPGQPLVLRELPIRSLVTDEVLVRVTAATLCGSDLHTISGRRKVACPTILGHEIIGRIECFGAEHSRRDFHGRELRIGDRVTWAIVANCGKCFFCLNELPQKCSHGVKYGHESIEVHGSLTGGLAEHVILAPKTSIFKLPEELSDEVACPANCATATIAAAFGATFTLRDTYSRYRLGSGVDQDVLCSVCESRPLSGRYILVIGGGMLGATACAMSKWLGASKVVCVEPVEERRRLVEQFGADVAVAPQEMVDSVLSIRGIGFDIAVEVSGVTDAMEEAIRALRVGGEMILVGAVFPVPVLNLLPEQVVRRMLTLQGLHNYAPRDLAMALHFLNASNESPFRKMVSHWLPLEKADEAVEIAGRLRVPRVGVRILGK
jgi:alcohol dehydrogenase